jgi:hypothetical protein
MVSPNEAGLNLGGASPCLKTLPDGTVSVCKVLTFRFALLCRLHHADGRRTVRTDLTYPVHTEEPTIVGIG